MNREILFKGIRKDNGQWEEGDLVHDAFDGSKRIKTGIRIPSYYPVEIIEGTECQFTGSTDKNGKKVFEGDYDKYGNVVVWCKECHGWKFGLLYIATKEMFTNCQAFKGNFNFQYHIGNFEVIGNINNKYNDKTTNHENNSNNTIYSLTFRSVRTDKRIPETYP